MAYAGVYLISCDETPLYIGSSKDLCRRLQEHRRSILKGKHPNRHLRAYLKRAKINLDALTWSVLGLCSEAELKKLEQIQTNYYLPICCDDVADLETADDSFKLFIFSRLFQRSRKFGRK
jgi:predicted GIY-YIG superfamily endonuclease